MIKKLISIKSNKRVASYNQLCSQFWVAKLEMSHFHEAITINITVVPAITYQWPYAKFRRKRSQVLASIVKNRLKSRKDSHVPGIILIASKHYEEVMSMFDRITTGQKYAGKLYQQLVGQTDLQKMTLEKHLFVICKTSRTSLIFNTQSAVYTKLIFR